MPVTLTAREAEIRRTEHRIVKLMFTEAVQTAKLNETKAKISASHERLKALKDKK